MIKVNSIPSRLDSIIGIDTHDIDLCTVKVLRMRHRSIGEVVRASVNRYDVLTTVLLTAFRRRRKYSRTNILYADNNIHCVLKLQMYIGGRLCNNFFTLTACLSEYSVNWLSSQFTEYSVCFSVLIAGYLPEYQKACPNVPKLVIRQWSSTHASLMEYKWLKPPSICNINYKTKKCHNIYEKVFCLSHTLETYGMGCQQKTFT